MSRRSPYIPKYAVFSDPHVGNHKMLAEPTDRPGVNSRCAITLRVINEVVEKARNSLCEFIVCCGDVFDTDRPSPQVEAAFAEVVLLGCSYGMDWHFIPGNHDQRSDAPGDHALAMLKLLTPIGGEKIYVHEKPTVYRHVSGYRMGFVPFMRSGMAEAFSALGKCDALFIHCGVSDGETAPWMVGTPDHIGLEDLQAIATVLEAQVVYAGNWHDSQIWNDGENPVVVQCGSACRTRFGEDHDARMYVHTATSPVPMDFSLWASAMFTDGSDAWADIQTLERTDGGAPSRFFRMYARTEDYEDQRARLIALKSAGKIAGFDLLPVPEQEPEVLLYPNEYALTDVVQDFVAASYEEETDREEILQAVRTAIERGR